MAPRDGYRFRGLLIQGREATQPEEGMDPKEREDMPPPFPLIPEWYNFNKTYAATGVNRKDAQKETFSPWQSLGNWRLGGRK